MGGGRHTGAAVAAASPISRHVVFVCDSLRATLRMRSLCIVATASHCVDGAIEVYDNFIVISTTVDSRCGVGAFYPPVALDTVRRCFFSGAVAIFRLEPGAGWMLSAILKAPREQDTALFGASLSLSEFEGNLVLVVGAPNMHLCPTKLDEVLYSESELQTLQFGCTAQGAVYVYSMPKSNVGPFSVTLNVSMILPTPLGVSFGLQVAFSYGDLAITTNGMAQVACSDCGDTRYVGYVLTVVGSKWTNIQGVQHRLSYEREGDKWVTVSLAMANERVAFGFFGNAHCVCVRVEDACMRLVVTVVCVNRVDGRVAHVAAPLTVN